MLIKYARMTIPLRHSFTIYIMVTFLRSVWRGWMIRDFFPFLILIPFYCPTLTFQLWRISGDQDRDCFSIAEWCTPDSLPSHSVPSLDRGKRLTQTLLEVLQGWCSSIPPQHRPLYVRHKLMLNHLDLFDSSSCSFRELAANCHVHYPYPILDSLTYFWLLLPRLCEFTAIKFPTGKEIRICWTRNPFSFNSKSLDTKDSSFSAYK